MWMLVMRRINQIAEADLAYLAETIKALRDLVQKVCGEKLRKK